MAWQEIYFNEILVFDQNVNDDKYRITESELHTVYDQNDSVSYLQKYNQVLFVRLLDYPRGRKEDFIRFNCTLAKEPKEWLNDLEELFESRKVLVGLEAMFLKDVQTVLEIIKDIRNLKNEPFYFTKKQTTQKKIEKYISFTYKQLPTNPDKLTDLWDSLKLNHFISKSTTLFNFKKVFSGGEIKTPIEWTGNISELFYFIKLIYSEHKLVNDLKQKQWEVTCLCFVDADGNSFDRSKFRSLKRPNLSGDKIEKAVSHLK